MHQDIDSLFLQDISSRLSAYDLMIQKYEVQNGNWYIQNVGIEQAFRNREIPQILTKQRIGLLP